MHCLQPLLKLLFNILLGHITVPDIVGRNVTSLLGVKTRGVHVVSYTCNKTVSDRVCLNRVFVSSSTRTENAVSKLEYRKGPYDHSVAGAAVLSILLMILRASAGAVEDARLAVLPVEGFDPEGAGGARGFNRVRVRGRTACGTNCCACQHTERLSNLKRERKKLEKGKEVIHHTASQSSLVQAEPKLSLAQPTVSLVPHQPTTDGRIEAYEGAVPLLRLIGDKPQFLAVDRQAIGDVGGGMLILGRALQVETESCAGGHLDAPKGVGNAMLAQVVSADAGEVEVSGIGSVSPCVEVRVLGGRPAVHFDRRREAGDALDDGHHSEARLALGGCCMVLLAAKAR